MKKGVYIHYSILCKLKTFYAANTSKFVAFPLIVALFIILELKRVLLHDLGVEQGSDDTGIAEKKMLYRIELVDAFLDITGPMSGLYKSRKDTVNYQKMHFTRSKQLDVRPEKLIQNVDGVLALCALKPTDCTEAGIIAAKITAITAKRDLFAPFADLSKGTIKLKKGITTKINVTDSEVADILHNQLDGAMKAIKDTEPQLYIDYCLLVEPIREGAHYHKNIIPKAPVTITAVHDLTGDPLDKIPIKFTGITGTFTTNAQGKIVANLPLGTRVGKITFIDFIPQSFTFVLTAEGYELTVRLVPVGV